MGAFIRLSPHFEHFNHTWVDTHSCQGHDYHDVLPFKDLMNENSGHYYTNQELYQLFDPMNPELRTFTTTSIGGIATRPRWATMRPTQRTTRCARAVLRAPATSRFSGKHSGSEHARAAPSVIRLDFR